jgi:hypothetical protein
MRSEETDFTGRRIQMLAAVTDGRELPRRRGYRPQVEAFLGYSL